MRITEHVWLWNQSLRLFGLKLFTYCCDGDTLFYFQETFSYATDFVIKDTVPVSNGNLLYWLS